jgi:acetyl-CoA acetyltransferase
MESMTNAPYLLLKGRGGYRMGSDKIYDHMMLDGLEDAYEAGRSMGTFGEDCAAKYSFTRAEQDAFATTSVQRAKAATESGAFAAEITPGYRQRPQLVSAWSVDRRRARQSQARQNHAACKPRLQKRRHHHRRHQLVHQRRRSRLGH